MSAARFPRAAKTPKREKSLPDPAEQKIVELTQQLTEAKQERDRLNQEARKSAEKRNEYHEQIKQLQTEVRELKEKRDEANLQVQILKAAREKAKAQRKEKCEQIMKLRERVKPLSERKPQARQDDLDKKIQNLEWRIQTSSLSIQEEKALVEQVKTLETQRATYKQLRELEDKLLELQTEKKALGTQARLKHDELSQLANQSQNFHEQLVEILSRTATLRQNADETHRKFMELRQKADEIHEKCVEIQRQIKSLKEELHRKEKQQYAEKGKMFREEATAKAREKMKRGEKLTWDEFKLVTADEETTEHERTHIHNIKVPENTHHKTGRSSLAARDASSPERTLVLCVDRDDDLGSKAGIKTPLIGREENINAAVSLALKDPEEPDANAIFEAVRIYDRFKEGSSEQEPKNECQIATIAGSDLGDVGADKTLVAELNQILTDFRASEVILVTDGFADEAILPLVQSRVPVSSVRRITVRHSESIEETVWLFSRYMKILFENPRYSRIVLGLPGVLLIILGILYMLNWIGYSWIAFLIVLGGAFVI